eukprot:2726729-Amphidinium_carterae.1
MDHLQNVLVHELHQDCIKTGRCVFEFLGSHVGCLLQALLFARILECQVLVLVNVVVGIGMGLWHLSPVQRAQDGKSSNLTSPNGPSQQAVVLTALTEAKAA